MSLTIGIEFISNKDAPILYPFMCKNVNAIAPPIIISSTFSNRLLINGILSVIFAPPKITK